MTTTAELRAAIEMYADHQSWRCHHVDRYWEDGHCPCGLTRVLDHLGIARVPLDEPTTPQSDA